MAITRNEPRTLVPAQPFVRTYSNRAYEDPWSAVEDYQQVQKIADEHENPSPTSIGNFLGIPRGRVEPWLGKSKPDCVRGLETANSHGWINVTTDGAVFRGLNILVAWISSSGSINKSTYTPYFVANGEQDTSILAEAGVFANLSFTQTQGSENGNTVKLRATEDGSVLGRVLSVLQAPTGGETTTSITRVPDYLAQIEEPLAQEFIQTYLHNRGAYREDNAFIRFRRHRSDEYLRSMARLLRRLTQEQVTVTDNSIRISPKGSRKITSWDPLPGFSK